MKTHVLITGGAGFVGSNLAQALLTANYEVTVVDDLSNGKKTNLSEDVHFVEADLTDNNWPNLIGNSTFEVVFHLAAQSSNATSFRNPIDDLNRNQLATLNVIQFCLKHRVRRLIFSSSMSVYGNPTVFPTPSNTPASPLTYYAVHKAASERYISLQHELNWTIFRLYTTYGFGQNLANLEQGLVKIFLGYLLRNEEIVVHGDLKRERDIIHVDDVVNALMLSIGQEKSFGKTYNLGTGQVITVDNLIAVLKSLAGKEDDYPILIQAADEGDPFRTQADIEETMHDLGWTPKYSIMRGLEETVRRYVVK